MLESLYVFIKNLQAFLVKLQLILFAWFYYELIKISKKYNMLWKGCGAVKSEKTVKSGRNFFVK